MQTPWGELGSLDLADHEVCRTILAGDKHQLAEGLVVESAFDQIFEDVPAHLEGAVLLDVDTAVVDTKRSGDQWHAFVWARSLQPGLGRYLQALERRFRVWLVRTDNPHTTFVAREVQGGRQTGPRWKLDRLMEELSGRRGQQLAVAADVRNAIRQQQSFWGFLSGRHQEELGQRVILPRLFMNCGVQPWFRAVWNLDRILVRGDKIWLLEIKHKYPMRGHRLAFGLNVGELGVIVRLGEAGIRCLHAIIVKPQWSKDAGAMYLFNDMQMRSRAALIGVDLNRQTTAGMLAGRRGSSAGHTTFSGEGKLAFHSIEAAKFSRVGVLADGPVTLATGLAGIIRGEPPPPVQDQWLTSLRAYPTG